MLKRDLRLKTVGQAVDQGELLRVHCNFCHSRRWFHPGDVVRLFGRAAEIENLHRLIRCGGCDRRDYIVVEAVSLTAQEKVGLVLRRLAKVYTVRRVVWRDERL